MHFLRRAQYCYLLRCGGRGGHIRTLYDAVASTRWPRDTGLDHAVARESHLKPLLNLKNLIVSEPSKSAPLSLINDSVRSLRIPFSPTKFIQKYASVFQEFYPSGPDDPHIKLTPEVVNLHSEEKLIYQSVNYKEELARRLLKLLMVSRVHQIPIFVLERLKWELGLPQDYEDSVIPEFPDFFRVIEGNNLKGNRNVLDLVCWNDDLAVSVIEKKGGKDGNIEFPLQYSKLFKLDKKYKKWVDDWQKLPYVSPYENATHLKATSDESDKWTVAVLHELLNLFVAKKAERDSLLILGEFLGLRSRFKRAFLQHPGIFYVSSKIRTHTVVLKDAYKRGMMIERHPLVDVRFKYAQLMNVVKDEKKEKEKKNGTEEEKGDGDVKKGGEESEDAEESDAEMQEDAGEDEAEIDDAADDDVSDDYEDSFDDDKLNTREFKRNEALEENGSRSSTRFSRRINAARDGDQSRFSRRLNTRHSNGKWFSRRTNMCDGDQDRYSRRSSAKDGDQDRFSRRLNTRDGDQDRFSRRSNTRDGNQDRFSRGSNTRDSDQRRFSRRVSAHDDDARNKFSRRSNSRDGYQDRFSRILNARDGDQDRFSRRSHTRDGDRNSSRMPARRFNFSENRTRSKTEKSPVY